MTTLALTGVWVPARAIRQWQPIPTPPPLNPADLIACPLCRATLTKPCRTAAGDWTIHDVRLVSRRCPCGNLPREGSHFCTVECRKAARAASYKERELRTPTRLRRRTA